jgi:glycosyltransferase involved in cell wall biosynthesis
MLIMQVVEASASGTLEIVRAISQGARAAGHEVIVGYGRRPETPADPAAFFGDGPELVALPWTDRRLAAQLHTGQALRRLVSARRPDVVHLHSSFAGAMGALAVGRGTPTVYTPHGYSFLRTDVGTVRRYLFRGAEWLIARRVDVVATVSAAEEAVARHALRAPRVATVANGIGELDELPSAGVRGAARVVAMGRVGPALAPVATTSILVALQDLATVEWIGGGPAVSEAPVRDAGIPITGWLGRDYALARLQIATVLVRWSAWDAAPVALLEAMAHDVVAIGSDIPANRELLGAHAVFRTPSEAIARIRTLLQDPTALREAIAAQRRRRRKFGASRMVEDWLRLYESVATGKASSAEVS